MAQTEKNLINAMLVQIGQSPVNEIDLSHPDVRSAVRILEDVNREVQSKEWWYNTELWTIIPQPADGAVYIPGNATAITTPDINWIKRGRRLYDLENHTFDFSDQKSIDILVTSEWSIEELPPTMYIYVLALCKKRMQVGFDFNANKVTDLEADVTKAFHYVQVQNVRFIAPSSLNQQVAQQVLLKKSPRY